MARGLRTGITVTGLGALSSFLDEMLEVAEWYNNQSAWVGTIVYYGPYLEFGTSRMPARPHWALAIQELISSQGEVGNLNPEAFFEEFRLSAKTNDPQALMLIALELERLVKEAITIRGLIDTGNYRGSISSGFTQDDVISKSRSRLTDPGSAAS